MAGKVKIRMGRPGDEQKLLELLITIFEESPVATKNEDKALAFITEILQHGVVIVAEIEDEIIGSIGLSPNDWWFSDDVFLADQWVIVHKDHRNSRAINRMLTKAKGFSDKSGVPLVLGVFSFTDTARKQKLFAKSFDPLGQLFAYGFNKDIEP